VKNITLFLVLLVFAFVPESAQAQDGYELETLIVSSGSDPITSGVSGIARFRKSNGRFAEVAAQSEQAWLAYGQYFEKDNLTFLAGGAVGHVQSAPVAGLRLDFSVRLNELANLDILYWPGVLFEEPNAWKTENDGVENLESILHAQFGGARLSIGSVQLSYFMLNFLDEPWNELPGISYTRALQDDLVVSLSATWNNNEQDWMPWIGLIWSP